MRVGGHVLLKQYTQRANFFLYSYTEEIQQLSNHTQWKKKIKLHLYHYHSLCVCSNRCDMHADIKKIFVCNRNCVWYVGQKMHGTCNTLALCVRSG